MGTQRTLAIIKPDAVKKKRVGDTLSRIEKSGLTIAAMKQIRMTPKQIESFYAEHRKKSFFPQLEEFMMSGPSIVMILEGNDVISRWRELMGATDPKKAKPGTIRHDLASDAKHLEENMVHGSDSPASAEREIAYFFSSKESS